MVTGPSLAVFVEGTHAGELRKRGGGHGDAAVLTYSDHYRSLPSPTPLSVCLPVSRSSGDADAWIDGALPDSPRTRQAWASKYSAASASPFDLLRTPAGLECAGAVQFSPPGRVPRSAPELRDTPDDRLALWARTARAARIPVVGPIGGRGGFSLPGAQPKHALYWDGEQWHVPIGGHPTNRILKIGVLDRSYPDADIAEHITMRAASALGLPVAHTELLEIGGERLLSVHRFDRHYKNGNLVRIHAEDFCQATGRSPVLKYERFDGGISAADSVSLIRRVSQAPGGDTRAFLDLLAFNWMTGGTDAHGKNFSLLLKGASVRTAPAYDLISMYGWEHNLDPACDGSLELAMQVGTNGYRLADGDSSEAWAHTARSCGVEPELVLSRIRRLLERCPDAFSTVIRGLPGIIRKTSIANNLNNGVAARARRAADRLGF